MMLPGVLAAMVSTFGLSGTAGGTGLLGLGIASNGFSHIIRKSKLVQKIHRYQALKIHHMKKRNRFLGL
jgi:hypothetical protein